MTRTLSISCWLLGLGFITLLYVTFTRQTTAPLLPQKSIPFNDELMEDVHAIQFDEAGHLTQILTVAQWQHQHGAPTAEWINPHLTLLGEKGTWTFSAKHGTSNQQELWGHIQEMHLSRNIVVHHTAPAPTTENDWWLKTEYLLILPDQQRAETTHTVWVDGPWMNMKSQGLKADLTKDSIEFLNTVNSHYTIPKKSGERIL